MRGSISGISALAAALVTLLSVLGGLVFAAALFGGLPIGLGAPTVLIATGVVGSFAALTSAVAAVIALRTTKGRTLARIALAILGLSVLAWAALAALAAMIFVVLDPAR